MSLYLIVLALLCIGAVDEGFIKKKTNNRLFLVLFYIMAFMLCLRYGQGTDYLGYKYTYVNMPVFKSIGEIRSSGHHGEFGWKLLCSMCNNFFKISFELFTVILSVIEMHALYRFINRYCPRKILALLVFYPTYYLTYYFSALRQGIVLSLFLGYLLEYCLNKNYTKYFVSVLALSLIHSAALILLALPLIHTFKFGLKVSFILTLGCFFVGSIIGFTGLKSLLPYSSKSFSIIAVAERLVSFAVVIIVCSPLYNKLIREGRKHIFLSITNVYILGMMIYGIFYSSDLLASRIIIFFKCMELILFGMAASYTAYKSYQLTYTYCILLAIVMTVKNINSYIAQMGYASRITVWNFPYVTLLNMDEIASFASTFFVNYFH